MICGPSKSHIAPANYWCKIKSRLPKLLLFTHTFSSVGQKKKKEKPKNIAVVWHEGLTDCSASEIASSFHAAITKKTINV